jgi:hypothetical protein
MAKPKHVGFDNLPDPLWLGLGTWPNQNMLDLTTCKTHDILGSAHDW